MVARTTMKPAPPPCIKCDGRMEPIPDAMVAAVGDYTATCDGCGAPQGTVREFAANGSLACPNEACNYALCNECTMPKIKGAEREKSMKGPSLGRRDDHEVKALPGVEKPHADTVD